MPKTILNALPRRVLLPLLGLWLGAGVVASVWLVTRTVDAARAAFETDARIAHRLMSQRAVQHDAILETLQLLQPEGLEGLAKRLAAVYPQVLDVRQGDIGSLVTGSEGASAERSLRVDWSAGRFWMTTPQTGVPAGMRYALEVSFPLMVPWSEWPFGDRPVAGMTEVAIALGPDRWEIQPRVAAHALFQFDFRKHLAADSQPFDLVARRSFLWADLPWFPMLMLWFGWTALAVVALTLWRQRENQRRAEALLRLGQVSRLNALGELAAGLAHELNQPLTAVVAGAQASRRLLEDEPPDVVGARDAMQQVAGQARRAAEVVSRLRRTIERPGASAVQPVDLGRVVRELMQLMAPECRRRGIAVQLPEGSGWVLADPVAVEQILHNLASNALHALEGVAAPRLSWALRASSGRVCLALSDNGPGLPPQVEARLFEPFVTDRADGLGLGLSLCETLAQEMNGRLWHEKPVRGTGATFVLELPASEGQGAA